MKISTPIILAAVCVLVLQFPVAAQPADVGAPDLNNTNLPEADAPPGAPDGQEAAPAPSKPIESTVILPKGDAPEAVPSAFTPPALATGGNSNDLNLNFNHAPLEMILSYLSDAAASSLCRTRASTAR